MLRFEGAPFRLSLESKAHRKARLFHTSGEMVPPQYSPSDRGLVRSAHAPARGSPRRARSFGDFAIKSRGKRGSARRVSSIFPLYKSQNEKLLFVYKVTITSRPTALGRDTVMRLSNDRAKSSMQNRSDQLNQIINVGIEPIR